MQTRQRESWTRRNGRASTPGHSDLWEPRPQIAVHLSQVRRRYRQLSLALVAMDAGCLILALSISYIIRFRLVPLPLEWMLIAATGPFIWVGVFHAFHLYQPQRLSSWEEFRNVISASGVGLLLVAVLSFWSHTTFSRSWLGLTWFVATVLELGIRRFAAARAASLRASGELAFRTLIVGANKEATEVRRALRLPHLGFNVVGHVSVRGAPISAGAVPILAHITELEDVIAEHQIDCLFVASTAIEPEDMLLLAQVARQMGLEVRVSANVPQVLTSRVTIQPLGEVMSLAMRPVRLTGFQTLVKRAFDLAVGASLLLVAALPMLLIAVLIKLTSRGPVLFRQHRVTKHGKLFSIYKFRTMQGAGDQSALGLDPDTLFFKLKDDPRLTGIGRFLRKTSLDELPQLFNVITGEMSLVGPRPLPLKQVEAHLEFLMARHEVPAGVTGWWQVQGRSDLTPEEAVRHDLFYIENWSLALDMYILIKTFVVVGIRRGAF